VARQLYDAWGNVRLRGDVKTDIGFTGQRLDRLHLVRPMTNLSFFCGGPMDAREIKLMDPRELMKVIYHELNQHSASALSFSIVLTDESKVPYVSDIQKDLLFRLKNEIESIRGINDMLRIWLSPK
jgi:hypothetical protein